MCVRVTLTPCPAALYSLPTYPLWDLILRLGAAAAAAAVSVHSASPGQSEDPK